MKKYTITAITEWYEDKPLIDGDCPHCDPEEVMDLVWRFGMNMSRRKIDDWGALPFTCMAENLDDALDQFNQKFCKYDYLKACDADYEVDEQVDESIEDLAPDASYEEIQDEVDDLPLDQFCHQLDFLVKSNDEKAKALYDTFKKGWKKEFHNIKVTPAFVKIRELHPTQNVIFAHKSLDEILKGTCKISGSDFAVDALLGDEAPQIEMGPPIVVCNVDGVNYLIDGHHRWSKAYAFNPNCCMKAYIINRAFNDAEDVLKFVQGALTIFKNKSPIVDVQPENDINLYEITPKELLDLIRKNVTQAVLDHISHSKVARNLVRDAKTLMSYLWSNIRTLKQHAPCGEYDREFMPQFPRVEENKTMKINENSKIILTIGQLKKLVKEARLNWKGPKVIKRKWDGDTGEVTFRLGKISDEEYYRNPARRCPVDITIATDMGHFSATAMIGNANDTGFNHAGQIIDLIADHDGYVYKQLPRLSQVMVDKIAGWWEQYHLKGLDKIPEEDYDAISQVIEYAKDYEVTEGVLKESDEVKLQMVALKKAYDQIKQGKREGKAGNWKIEALGAWNDEMDAPEHGGHWVYFKGAPILEVNYETMEYCFLMETAILSKEMVDAMLETLECKDFSLEGDGLPDFLDGDHEEEEN